MTRGSRSGTRARRLALLIAAVLLAGASHHWMDTSTAREGGERFVPRPELARLAALGFNALVADAYWLQAIQLLGGERQGAGAQAPLLARLVDVVTTVDPWVGHPYRFAALWLTESVDSVRRANALLERAISYHPMDWRNRHYLGFNHFFYLSDGERAADVLETAVGLPGAPYYLASLVAKLRSERDGLETAQAFLTGLAASTTDGYARASYEKGLDEILTERRARVLDAAREEYRRRFGRDIRQVADLLRGPRPVLRALPPAHPHFPDFRWVLDEETGEIVSSFYRGRFAPYVHRFDRDRRERWRRQIEREAEAG